MTNEEFQLLIDARVKEALQREKDANSEKKKNAKNILVDDYCYLYNTTPDTTNIDHVDNIKFLKRAYKHFQEKDPKWEQEKKIVAHKLQSFDRLIDHVLEQERQKMEDEELQ